MLFRSPPPPCAHLGLTATAKTPDPTSDEVPGPSNEGMPPQATLPGAHLLAPCDPLVLQASCDSGASLATRMMATLLARVLDAAGTCSGTNSCLLQLLLRLRRLPRTQQARVPDSWSWEMQMR